MHVLFIGCEPCSSFTAAHHSHNKHIDVIPMPRPSNNFTTVLGKTNIINTRPSIRNVTCSTPTISPHFFGPRPYIQGFAQTENNVPFGFDQCIRHGYPRNSLFIKTDSFGRIRCITPVIFKVIEAPCCVALRIFFFVI